MERTLTKEDQMIIKDIAFRAVELNKNLKFENCYSITLLYFLCQYSGFDVDSVPFQFQKSVELLYKNPISSYLHYRNGIHYSNDEYAKTIKIAECERLGDDPRCPW